jgi:GT2 family glycosyltransferase
VRNDSPPPRVSVVVVSLNEGGSLRQTIENIVATTPADREIVVVDDGSDDGSSDFIAAGQHPVRLFRTNHVGVARARNFGARRTTGEAVVFADAHIELPHGWWSAMLEALENPAVGAVAPSISVAGEPTRKGFGLRFEGPNLEIEWLEQLGTTPYDVPILPGCCLAMRRTVFDATGGFDDGMIRSGGIDNELALRLWLLGYALRVVPQVTVLHAFRDEHPYPIFWRTVLYNKMRLAFVHFGPQRLVRVTEALSRHPAFADGLALTVGSNVAARRKVLEARRRHNDDWFFERFGAL